LSTHDSTIAGVVIPGARRGFMYSAYSLPYHPKV
jgi:hypothetical protein